MLWNSKFEYAKISVMAHNLRAITNGFVMDPLVLLAIISHITAL